ncbi:amino acid/amide ABC transporter substrate-binding protein, HAAT family [Malonomonas rubra DSM 5091]|uniref:Amino acid/amide ABC transporter substrate-binding protein, HAAT family n=1 Tax=Malonomonas rubra DSM 5091 TaxID=1122189 RepID=A0A1M6HB84_MALRU|nr:penicillin-binding protein activator [Malonomonas rubra]SHJ19450.1 amino acid/amide ABC transporter substrate-binding protein, HAAT family [Malonomonas rubra DSM 5091]
MKRIVCLLLFCALSSALPVYSLTFAPAEETAAAVADFERGQQLFHSGSKERALATLRTSVQRDPGHPKANQAYTLIGRIFIEQKRYPDALLYLERIPAVMRSPEADLLRGYCLVQTGDFAGGQAQLLPLLGQSFSVQDTELLLLALTDAAVNLQQPLNALFFIQKALPLAENQASLLERAHRLLQGHLSDIELEEAAFMWQGTAIGQDARLQLARRALGQQQQQKATHLLQMVLASDVTFPYWQEAEMLLQRSSMDSWFNRDSIGVLLPLSGRYASYGELVKRGLELAVREHNRTRLPVRLVYRDTAVEGVSTSQLVSSLTDDAKVMAIVGPLLGAGAEEAATRAQLEMVPLISLSQRAGLPQRGDFVFRDSLTAEQQIQSLVRYAIDTQHISFSVLRPENRLGEEMTRLFVDEVRRFGGEIVDIVSYPEEGTDFRKQIQSLLWEDYVVDIPPKPELPEFDEFGLPIEKKEEDKKEPEELEYPLAPFHALFMPDYAERISVIAPQLKFYGIKDVTLLGINGWNAPELVERAGRFLDQAVFVDGFFSASSQPEVQRFVELYRQAYEEEPTILSAQAFDAANMLLLGMDDATVRNRDDLRQRLAALRGFRGVSGTVGFDAMGEAIKQPYLLGVKRRRIVEIN